MTQEMLRYNRDKPRWGLLPIEALIQMQELDLPFALMEDLVDTYSAGALKYADNNWRIGGSHLKVLDSAMRHVVKIYHKNEIYDKESGLDHRGHISWNIMTLLVWLGQGVGVADTNTAKSTMLLPLFDPEATPDPYLRLLAALSYYGETSQRNALILALNIVGDTYR